MTGRGRRRRAAGGRGAVLGALAVATRAHVALAGAAGATGVLTGWSFTAAATSTRPAAPAIPRPPLRPSCDADALLVAGARAVVCASPFVDQGARCLVDVGNRLESDRLRCHIDQLEAALVSIAPIDIDKIPPIDPEMLLDEEAQLQPAPPPVPELIALAAQQPPPPPPPPPPTPPAAQAPRLEEQVVEVAQPPSDVVPDNARFLAEQNSRVERQTVARGAVDEPMTAKPSAKELEIKPDAREPSSSKPPDVAGQRADAPRAPGLLSMRAAGPRKPSEVAQDARTAGPLDGATGPRGDGSRRARGNSLFAAEARQRAIAPGDGGGGGGTDAIPDLRASQDVLERVAGGGSVDHLEDVDVGDETSLSSRQFVYASFFNRAKRSVAQVWHPAEVFDRHDPTLMVNGFKDRTTRVRVTLSPSGELINIIVTEPSGFSYLDDEGVRAFRAAQPFPNPPPGLINAAGVISFTFGFHVSVSGNRTDWRFFRE